MKMRKILILIYRGIFKILSGYGIERRFSVVKRVHKFIVSHLKSNFAEVQGYKMFLDDRDSLRLSINGIYSPLGTAICKKEIKKGDIVLDLGAHIGYYTLIFARLVGDKGKVFAFEPNPINFSLLKKNVEINGFKNVVLIQKAVSSKNGKVKLFLSEIDTGDNRIYDSRDGRKFVIVETTRLDDYFKNYKGKINFIKMDIQGAEGGAIKEMSNLLRKNKNLKIFTEFWPWGLREFGIKAEEFLKLLLRHKFILYRINEQENKIEPISIDRLIKEYTPERKNDTDLLCIKEKQK